MSLPASARRRWGLVEGGEVSYLDLGDTIVIAPGGLDELRAQLLDLVNAEDWEEARSGFGDAELATE